MKGVYKNIHPPFLISALFTLQKGVVYGQLETVEIENGNGKLKLKN